MKPIPAFLLGRLAYPRAMALMDRVVGLQKVRKDRDCLLLCQHDPVYTVGIRDKLYSEEEEKRLRDLGAEFYRTGRGGLITFHGPGQLVVYPVLNLRNFGLSGSPVRWYVARLEEVVIDLCANLGLEAGRSELNPGVWIGTKKVCAIGIRVSNGITSHGVGLNCDTDLSWYDHIVPCGIKDPSAGVTSLSVESGKRWTVPSVAPLFLDSFARVFQLPVLAAHEKLFDGFVR